MKRLFHVGLAAALSTCALSNLQAQTCAGLPLSEMNFSASIASFEGGKGYAGRFGIVRQGGFGGVTLGYNTIDDADDLSIKSFGADVGTSLPIVGRESRVRLCPVLSAAYLSGPSASIEGHKVEQSGLQIAGGLALGSRMILNPALSIIPNASISLLHLRFTTEMSGPLLNDKNTSSDTGGLLGIGLTLLFNEVFAIQPTVSFPLGFEDSDPTVGLTVSIGFGKR